MRARPRAAFGICSAIESDATTHRTPNSEALREDALSRTRRAGSAKIRGACSLARPGADAHTGSPAFAQLRPGEPIQAINYQLSAFPPTDEAVVSVAVAVSE